MTNISGKFVRASKYRHVFGQSSKREANFENLKITKNAWDSNIINSNGKYLSVNWDSSGGGAFAIIPLLEPGKAPDRIPLFRGHKGPILDTAFNPFNPQEIVSVSDDGKVFIWTIPDDFSIKSSNPDEIEDITTPKKILSGHTRKVGHVKFHPCAENVIATSSMDYSVKIWNTKTGEALITLKHPDLVTCFAFNYNGSKLVTTSRDKKLRIWDIRSGEIISEGQGHTGAKPSRVVWLGNTDRIITTGFSRLSDRQLGIWNVNDISAGPIDGFLYIDSSSGVLIPFFDESTSLLFLAGKGDGNIRYYEYDNDILYELSQYSSIDAQRGFAVAPKIFVNLNENEIVKAFKTVNDSSVEPISFIVPRRSELFQDDIYPDAPSSKPAISAEDWFSGKNVNGPLLLSMESVYDGTSQEEELKESTPETSVSDLKKQKEQDDEKAKEVKKESADKKTDTSNGPSKSPSPSPAPPKNVDEALKSSSEVSNLLNKVNDISDDENNSDSDKDEWEHVKPQSKSVSPEHSVSKSSTTELPKKAQLLETKLSSNSKESKADTLSEIKSKEPAPLNTKSEAKPEETKSSAKASDSKLDKAESSSKSEELAVSLGNSETSSATSPTSTATNTPKLKDTVEKLAGIASQFEEQISKLIAANLEKDARLEALEKKVEQLLQK